MNDAKPSTNTLPLLHETALDPATLKIDGLSFEATALSEEQSFSELAATLPGPLQIWWAGERAEEVDEQRLELLGLRPEVQVLLLLESSQGAATELPLGYSCEGVVLRERAPIALSSWIQRLLASRELEARLSSERMAHFLLGFQTGSARLLHDLNSPLTAVQNSLELLSMNLPEELLENNPQLRTMSESLQRIELAVNEWHSYLHAARPPMGSCDVTSLLQDLCTALKSSRPRLRWELLAPPEGLGLLPMARSLLEPILHPVLLNGVEAAMENPRPRLLLRLELDENKLHIDVEDSGPGVDKAIEESFWKDFVSTREGRHGMSLGIVRYLLMMVGGSISLEQARQLPGACLRISLPRRKRKNIEGL